jgi:hypothetical protein
MAEITLETNQGAAPTGVGLELSEKQWSNDGDTPRLTLGNTGAC